MILELVGLPGSGKSECEEMLSASLRDSGFQVTDQECLLRSYQVDKAYHKLGLNRRWEKFLIVRAIAHWVFRLRIHLRDCCNRLSIGRPLATFSEAKRLPFKWLAVDMLLTEYFHREFATDPGRIYLSSEGLVHHTAAVRVWSGAGYRDISQAWLGSRPRLDLCVVHVTVPLEVAFERLWRRGVPRSWPRRVKSSESAARRVLERFDAAIEDSLAQFRSAGACVVTLSNDADKQKLRREVGRVAKSVAAIGRPSAEPAGPTAPVSGSSRNDHQREATR